MNELTFRNIGFLLASLLIAGLVGWLISVSDNWLIVFPLILIALVIIMRPFLGLLLFVFLIPLESSFLSLGGGASTVTRIVGLFIFGVWSIGKISNRRKILIPDNFKMLIIFIFWGSVSVIWAFDKSTTLIRIVTAIQLLMLAMLILNLIKDQKQFKHLITSLFIGCFTVTLFGILGIGVNSDSYLLTLQNQGAKEYGLYVGIVFLFGSLLFIFQKNRFRLMGLFAIAFSIVPLIQVNQRGIFFAIAATWLVIAVISRQKIKSIIFIIFLSIIMTLLPDLLYHNNIINLYNFERLTINNLLETGGTGRIDIWGVGLRMLSDNIISGVGWGNFPVLFSKYADSIELVMANYSMVGRDPHGDLVGVAGELGLIGLLIFLIAYIKLLFENISLFHKVYDPNKKLMLIFVIALLVYFFSAGLTSTILWRKIYWVVFGLAIILPSLISFDQFEKHDQ